MDLFRKTSKVSISTIIFGFLTMVLGWILTEVSNQITQIQIGEIALVFLSLFFFSLISDKVRELEEKIIFIRDKKTAKQKTARRPIG